MILHNKWAQNLCGPQHTPWDSSPIPGCSRVLPDGWFCLTHSFHPPSRNSNGYSLGSSVPGWWLVKSEHTPGCTSTFLPCLRHICWAKLIPVMEAIFKVDVTTAFHHKGQGYGEELFFSMFQVCSLPTNIHLLLLEKVGSHSSPGLPQSSSQC